MSTSSFVARAIVALLVVTAVSGCVSNAPLDITHSGRESIIPSGFSVTNVRLTTRLATLEDSLTQMGNQFNVQSGKVFRQVFTGGEEAPVYLDIVNSSMSQGLNNVLVLATKTNVTYSASVLLVKDGEKHVLSSTATAGTAWTIDRAAREAVERVVIDLAKQTQVYMDSPPVK